MTCTYHIEAVVKRACRARVTGSTVETGTANVTPITAPRGRHTLEKMIVSTIGLVSDNGFSIICTI